MDKRTLIAALSAAALIGFSPLSGRTSHAATISPDPVAASEPGITPWFEISRFDLTLDGQSHQSDVARVIAGKTYQGQLKVHYYGATGKLPLTDLVFLSNNPAVQVMHEPAFAQDPAAPSGFFTISFTITVYGKTGETVFANLAVYRTDDGKMGGYSHGQTFEICGQLEPEPEPEKPTPGPVEPEPGPVEPEPEPGPGPTEPEPGPGPTEPGPGPTEPEPGPGPTEPEPGPGPIEPEPGPGPTEPEPGPGPTEPEPGSGPTKPEPGPIEPAPGPTGPSGSLHDSRPLALSLRSQPQDQRKKLPQTGSENEILFSIFGALALFSGASIGLWRKYRA